MIRHPWLHRSRAMRQRDRILKRRAERASSERGEVAAPRTRLSRIAAKALGLVALLAISGLLYDSATSPGFRVRLVSVSGNRLLSADEVLAAAAVHGVNVFAVRRQDIAVRVERLAAAQSAEVRIRLPDRVDILVTERIPYVSWQSGETRYLVDAEGLVLGTQEPEQPLIVIHDLDAAPLVPGVRVDLAALRTVAGLNSLLPTALGLAPTEYDYSRAFGVEVQEPNGPRIRFGTDEMLDAKVATLRALKRELTQRGVHPTLIDLRFPSRPYYREQP